MENAVAKNLFASKFYPTPVNDSPTNNAYNTVAQAFNANQGDAKIDWDVPAKIRSIGRYSQGYQNNPLSNSLAILGNNTSTAPTHNVMTTVDAYLQPQPAERSSFGHQLDHGVHGHRTSTVRLAIWERARALPTPIPSAPVSCYWDSAAALAPAPGIGTITNVGNAVVAQNFADTVIQFDDGLVK